MTETSEILPAVLEELRPLCTWIARINGGKFMLKGRGHPHVFQSYRLYRSRSPKQDPAIKLPDLIGQLRDGRFLAVEVKGVRGVVSAEQAAFLALVRTTGGVAAICYDREDAHDLAQTIRESPP